MTLTLTPGTVTLDQLRQLWAGAAASLALPMVLGLVEQLEHLRDDAIRRLVPVRAHAFGYESRTSILNMASAQLGKRYEWAAAGPDAFDCSGLTMAAWPAAGVALPHLAAAQTG